MLVSLQDSIAHMQAEVSLIVIQNLMQNSYIPLFVHFLISLTIKYLFFVTNHIKLYYKYKPNVFFIPIKLRLIFKINVCTLIPCETNYWKVIYSTAFWLDMYCSKITCYESGKLAFTCIFCICDCQTFYFEEHLFEYTVVSTKHIINKVLRIMNLYY